MNTTTYILLISSISLLVVGGCLSEAGETSGIKCNTNLDFECPSYEAMEQCEKSLDFSACEGFKPNETKMYEILKKKKDIPKEWFGEGCEKPTNFTITPNKTSVFVKRESLCESSAIGDDKRLWKAPKGVVVNKTFYYVLQVERLNCTQTFQVNQCKETNEVGGQPHQQNCKINNQGLDLSESVFKSDNKLNKYHYYCAQKWSNTPLVAIDMGSTSKEGNVVNVTITKPSHCGCVYYEKKEESYDYNIIMY